MLKTKAIVLSQKNFRNHDALISFYSLDFGKVNLIARGLKKSSSKLAGHLEPLNLVDLMIIKGRERDYVGSAISENSFLDIKGSYEKVILAGSGLKFLSDLTFEKQPDYNIFLLLNDFLYFLNKADNNFIPDKIDIFLYFFKLKLLEFLGYNFSSFDKIKSKTGSLMTFSKIDPDILSLKELILSLDLEDFDFLKKIEISLKEKNKIDNFIKIIKEIIY